MTSVQNRVQLRTVLLFSAIMFAGVVQPAVGSPQAAEQSADEDLPQDCSGESLAAVKARAHKGDVHAQHLIGMQYYLGACGDPDRAAAIKALSKSAAQFYPPSMFHLATNLQMMSAASDKTLLALYLGAAERGFRKAELDVVRFYSRKKSPVYNRPQAYAWVSYCSQHDSFCSDEIPNVMTGMTARDKQKGEELKAKLDEKMRTVPKFDDVFCCNGSGNGAGPRRE